MPLAYYGDRLSAARTMYEFGEEYGVEDYVDLDELAIQFTCKDCGEEIERAPHHMDVPGLTPVRCASCTFDRMGER